MREYEVVREIQNLCMNNQMRDIFFDEIETDDPQSYVRTILKSDNPTLTVDRKSDGSCVIFAATDGLTQKFVFTPL